MRRLSARPSVLAAPLGLACALAVGSAAALPANEDFGFETTEDLYQVCSTEPGSPESVPAAFACRAFLEATMQYHDAVSGKRMKRLVCYPVNTTIAQARAVFVEWAKANAGDAALMGEPPVKGVIRAMGAKYPCK